MSMDHWDHGKEEQGAVAQSLAAARVKE